MIAGALRIAASGVFTTGNVISTVAVVTLLIAAGTIVGASFRNGRSAQVLANYKGLAESYRDKYSAQEQEIHELQEQARVKDIEIEKLKERVSVLQDLITGRAAFEQLASDMTRLVTQTDTRTAEALAQYGEIRGEIREVRDAVEAVATALARRPR